MGRESSSFQHNAYSNMEEHDVEPSQRSSGVIGVDVGGSRASASSREDEAPPMTEQQIREAKTAKRIKFTARASLLIIIVVVVILVVVYTSQVKDVLVSFLDWVQTSGAVGPIVFALVYILGTIIWLPGLILTIGAGIVFSLAYGQGVGILIAVITVYVGALIGSSLAFLIARYILRDQVEKLTKKYPKFSAIDNAIGDNGLKMIFLLRLSPVIPYNAFNYVAGLTRVRFRDYALASFGMLPGTIVYCFFGSTLGQVADATTGGLTSGGTATLVLLIVGSVLAILVSIYVSFVAKKYIDRQTSQIDAEEGPRASQVTQERETKIQEPEDHNSQESTQPPSVLQDVASEEFGQNSEHSQSFGRNNEQLITHEVVSDTTLSLN